MRDTGDVSGDLTQNAPDPGRRSLIRLRWGLRVAALIALCVLELYYILVLRRAFQEVLLDLSLGTVLSLGLIQICFSVVFRLHDQTVTDREQLADHTAHLKQLYAISQRLIASLRSDATQISARTASPPLNERELSSALQDLADVFDARQGSLLLLDTAGQPQQFVHVGLAPEARPGPQPGSPLEGAQAANANAGAWMAYLLPGADRVTAFAAAPVVAGERHRGYLALVGDSPLTPQDQSLLNTFAGNLGVVLENALLFQDTQRKLTEAATLANVSQTISSKLTHEDLLPYLAEKLGSTLDATGCFIILHHPHTGELQPLAAFGSYQQDGVPLPMSDRHARLTRAVIEAGHPITVTDVNDSPDISPPTTVDMPDKSLLALPLVVQDQTLGAVIIGESRQRRYFSEDEIGLAMVVAHQAAVAISNARLFREVERRMVELGTLAELSRVIVSPLQFPAIYQKVVNELARAFGYPFVAFYYVEKETLGLGAQVGYAAGHLPDHIPWGRGLIGDAAATGQTGYIPNVSALPDHTAAAEGVVSQIAMPLRTNGRVLGVLSVESQNPLTEADLSLLQSVSSQVSTVIENARLYVAEQREREVARTLLQIAGDLSGTLHLDEVLNLILERLRAVVPYETATIGLLAGDVCYIAAAHDLPYAQRVRGKRLPVDELPSVARVLNERAPVIVDDILQSDDWAATVDSEHVRSWLGVPLVVQDRTIGLLMLNQIAPAFYDQEAARLALAFAQHAALAIDNARLYEHAQVKLHELTLLHEMTEAVSSTLDAGQVLRFLAERLVTVLGVTSTRIATLADESRTATLVTQHSSADANEAEQASQLGQVYDLTDLAITAERLKTRQPLLVIAGEEPDEWRAMMRQRMGQAMLLLPLVARDRVTGFVELWDSRSQRRFAEAEIALAQTLTNQAAVAIDNARLFAETQRSISELMLLYDIAVSAASTLDLDTILQSVVKTLQFRVFEKSVVNVWLIDVIEDVLQLRAHAGELTGMTKRESLQLDEGLCGQVAQTGQPILVSDSHQDPRCSDYGPDVGSILCVPLAWGQRTMGAIEALSGQQNAFSSHDLRLLHTMAGSLAIAIENVRLFTELKRSEEALTLRNRALERANDRLQELDRLKSAFIASVSHELRTPLNSIIGFSEVILDGLAGDLQPVAQEYLGYIHDSGKHLLDLIDDILDLSKIQAGRMTLTLGQVDVMKVVDEARATLAPMISQKKQTFTIKQGKSLPTIVADRFRLKQILLNLLSNACKHTQEGAQIEVRAWLADPITLQLDVADNGPGIALEDQGVIFEEFRQARTTRSGEGTGLGLAITRRLVELHSGRVWVESQPGAGATFTILLPIAGPDPEEPSMWEEVEREVL